MRRKAIWIGLTALIFAAGPLLAQEVVYFTNGTTMPVMSHDVEDGMVHVALSPGSSMAFPMDQVDRIVKGGEEVFNSSLMDASTIKNRMHAGARVTPVMDTRVSGRPMSHQINGEWSGNKLVGNPNVERTQGGMAVYKPYAGTGQANESRSLTGRLDMLATRQPAGGASASNPNVPSAGRPFGMTTLAKMPGETGSAKPLLRRPTMKPVTRPSNSAND
jgi:hypothetical protein